MSAVCLGVRVRDAVACAVDDAVDVRIWRHAYATSHPLYGADVGCLDGRRLELVVKDGRRRPCRRPAVAHRAEREGDAYELLARAAPGVAPRLVSRRRGCLVLERVDGVPLWESADPAALARAARTARVIHALGVSIPPASLLRYDEPHYLLWLRRAVAAAPRLRRHEALLVAAAARLLEEPRVLVHGELYPSNVVVGSESAFAIDWESAAIGPAVVDVAALVEGWPDDRIDAALAAYGPVDPVALDCARAHLALRWVGWAEGWEPPAEHRRDWVGQVELIASRLRRSL